MVNRLSGGSMESLSDAMALKDAMMSLMQDGKVVPVFDEKGSIRFKAREHCEEGELLDPPYDKAKEDLERYLATWMN